MEPHKWAELFQDQLLARFIICLLWTKYCAVTKRKSWLARCLTPKLDFSAFFNHHLRPYSISSVIFATNLISKDLSVFYRLNLFPSRVSCVDQLSKQLPSFSIAFKCLLPTILPKRMVYFSVIHLSYLLPVGFVSTCAYCQESVLCIFQVYFKFYKRLCRH